jgi:glutamyl-Q tRNA(Asp) synthetase
MSPAVFRFAPSPNGYLHLGHALSALINFDMARAALGRFLLRIEDIDRTRCRPQFEQAIYEDLEWLGLTWEEPVRRQSAHFGDYRAALARLDALGLLYPSFESRGEIARMVAERDTAGDWPRDPDGAPVYPGNARSLSVKEREARMQSGAPYALRLDMKTALARVESLSFTETGAGPSGETGTLVGQPQLWGDVILARKEMPTSYHLSVVIDDALQGITHVVRGHDLFFATSVHRLLQELLGLPQPIYHHHQLILDEHGQKLSKSSEATALRSLRKQGATAAGIRSMVALL